MARQTIVDAFEESVATHFKSPPDTWSVRRIDERVWWIVGTDDSYALDRFETKREAGAALESGNHSYRRNWESRDRWYRQTDNDPRSRALESWEIEIIARHL